MKLVLLFVTISVAYISCSKSSSSSTEPPPSISLQSDKQSISLSGRINTTDSISIQSNTNWTIAFSPSNPSWLSVSDSAGKGNKKIILTIKEPNNTGSSRLVTMNVNSAVDSSTLRVTITQQANDELTINAINPTNGPANSEVTISGTAFNVNTALDSVYFNGKPASVISATATSIIVKVPVSAGTGNVSVKVGSRTATGPVFNYQLSPVAVLIAGAGYAGIKDGIGAAASFAIPTGLTLDDTGNIYVADLGAYTIRKVSAAGNVITLAGTALQQGNRDGTGTNASFRRPNDVVVDMMGNVFVADFDGSNIRKITPNGIVSTFVADMSNPTGITIDHDGFIYLVSPFLKEVRKIAPNGTWTPLGSGLYNPFDIAVDDSGNLYIVDSQGQTVSKMTPAGVITQIAGIFGEKGFANGPGASATFNTPKSIAVDKDGNIYVADVGNNAIRKISTSGIVSTYLDHVSTYTTDGNFFGPYGVSVDKNGVVHFTNTSENKVMKIVMK